MPELRIIAEGQPIAKGRPRFGRGRTFTDARTASYEEALRWQFRAACRHPFEANIAVEAVFYRSNKQRIDVDNLLKAALDAATGILWKDDSQVTEIAARLEYDAVRPRAEIVVREGVSTMARGTAADSTATCERCGKTFVWRPYASRSSAPRFCSRACVARRPATCPECNQEFTTTHSRQTFCSKGCAAKSKATRAKIANAAKARARPRTHCIDCGAELARRDAKRCRSCWLKAPDKTVRKADL